MKRRAHNIWLTAILMGAGAGLYYGWRLFWFMTDDALIAFRYVSNSMLGFGYVWNAPPFMPVEGYTSFLWVVLLDIIWRWFGAEPPQIANWLSLLFSALTLGMTAWIVLRMTLTEHLARFRLGLLSLVLLGIVSNRTFLAWTSSGLETALFNFCFTLWIVIAVMISKRGTGWLFGLSLAASLVYLARPDGLLILACTVLIAALWLRAEAQLGHLSARRLVGLLPLAIPVIHLIWRQSVYGEWLPNTYYAKHVAAWPEAGLRYLASFALEYSLWFWLGLLVWLAFRWLRHRPSLRDFIGTGSGNLQPQPVLTLVVMTIIAHVGYYTFIIGGDHFEYRVFSYLVPLVFVSCLWMLNRLTRDSVIAAGIVALFILASWPIPWTHWAITRPLTTRSETWIMRVPVASQFPVGTRWYAEAFDDLQSWLIKHHVCMRHQEHRAFYEHLSAKFPPRTLADIPQAGQYPVLQYGSVGVPGWVFPRVAVIDRFGLNDYVIARHPTVPEHDRRMAHDRYAPVGYWASFSPNYGLLANGSAGFVQRDFELTAEEIVATEKYWVDLVVHGIEAPMTYSMSCRIGESRIRTKELDTAIIALETALTVDSMPARAYLGLARCQEYSYRYDSALALLRIAAQREPENRLVWSRMGTVLAGIGYDLFDADPEQARNIFGQSEAFLLKSLEKSANPTEALVELASINLFLDRVDSSAVFLGRLEQCVQPSPAAIHVLGNRYIYKDHRTLAFRAFALAIQNGLNPVVTTELLELHEELKAFMQSNGVGSD